MSVLLYTCRCGVGITGRGSQRDHRCTVYTVDPGPLSYRVERELLVGPHRNRATTAFLVAQILAAGGFP